jgi:hypothetical protein
MMLEVAAVLATLVCARGSPMLESSHGRHFAHQLTTHSNERKSSPLPAIVADQILHLDFALHTGSDDETDNFALFDKMLKKEGLSLNSNQYSRHVKLLHVLCGPQKMAKIARGDLALYMPSERPPEVPERKRQIGGFMRKD